MQDEHIEAERAKFEAWVTEDGKWPMAARRTARGDYSLMSTHTAWTVWQAARATQGSAPADSAAQALRWATELAVGMARKHYPEAAGFDPLPDIVGVISQIDNMVTGLVRPAPAAQQAPADEDAKDLERMREANKWHHLNDVMPVLKAARAGQWQWYLNSRCKYVELRIDMRDLGCLIMDRDRQRITPKMLAHQSEVAAPQQQGGEHG